MGIGGISVTFMVVERYHSVEKAKIKPKNNIKAKLKSSRPNLPKKAKKEPKGQSKNFKANQKRPNLTNLALCKVRPCVRPNGNPGRVVYADLYTLSESSP